ncbi:MAG TPA: FAD-binding oxidoreductase [Gemmatimonadaceae bacterium]
MTLATSAPSAKSAAHQEIDALVHEALSTGRKLRVAGAGTWLDAGRPVDGDSVVSTRALNGIVEYVPGDLTLTAGAGTSLAEIRDATAPHRQWLALDPCGSDDGTLGATVATASAGPLATAFGAPRDLVLGVEFIAGTGAVVRGGGRVVKNVAGFDLVRLLTGSWGTLGVITEITVRLHARPQTDESFAVEIGEDDTERVRLAMRRLPFTPYACELVNAAMASAIGLGASPAMLARVGGNSELVDTARAALREIGSPREIDGDVWRRLRGAEPARASVFRVSSLSSNIGDTWRRLLPLQTGPDAALLHATPARGVVRCIVPSSRHADADLERIFTDRGEATIVGERLSSSLWTRIAPTTNQRLSSGIKDAFDPSRLLNRGILGEQS